MKYIKTLTTEGNRREPVYDINDTAYFLSETDQLSRTYRKKGNQYYGVPLTFDIESTSIPNVSRETSGVAFMYHWQMCINGNVVFGTRWEEWIALLTAIAKSYRLTHQRRLVIYVHNLSYEFQFMKDFLHIEGLFAREKRKIIKFLACPKELYLQAVNRVDQSDYPLFEFRCSYFLSNMSLEKFCENEGALHCKATDVSYNYRLIRTPDTPPTEDELAYDYNDVAGLYESLLHRMESRGDNIVSIPLTSTGYVRRDMRMACRKDVNYHSFFMDCYMPPEVYNLARQAFRGGNTHASRYMAGAIIRNVHSFDLKSSYPAWMLSKQYPMGGWTEYHPETFARLLSDCATKCIIMQFTITDVEIKSHITVPYIDIGHCTQYKKCVRDNGRVLKAQSLTFVCTNVDFKIICNQYSWDVDNFVLNEAYVAEYKDYLPEPIRNTIYHYFEKKTMLDGEPGKEYEYAKSKNDLNSCYGMMVTDIVHSIIDYDNGEWTETKPTDIERQLQKYYSSRNNFLSYAWGVYVTAYAREEWQVMCDAVSDSYVYGDTDSVKATDVENDDICALFASRNDRLRAEMDTCGIKTYVDKQTPDGLKRVQMGLWEYEGCYDEFVTLGAKKYAVNQDGKITVTVAGLSKKLGSEYLTLLGGLNAFQPGLIFPSTYKYKDKYRDYSGRTSSEFIESTPHEITVTDYLGRPSTFTTASAICITPVDYTLGVTDEYFAVLEKNDTILQFVLDFE